MISEAQVRAAIAAYFDAIRRGDREAWVATFAEDAESYEPGGEPLRGHEALRAFFDGVTGAFETVGLYEQEIFVVGDQAAVKWTGEGKGKNGHFVSFAGIDVFSVNDDGRIQTLRAYWNPAAMMAELAG